MSPVTASACDIDGRVGENRSRRDGCDGWVPAGHTGARHGHGAGGRPRDARPGPAADTFVPGSNGLGDPFFPLAGNGGYDVSHYALRLSYEPQTHHLVGSATISATATQNLSRFDLDLRGFDVSRLTVNGQAASFTRAGQELVITPQAGLPAARPFTAEGWTMPGSRRS
jgi:hypothetical protein